MNSSVLLDVAADHGLRAVDCLRGTGLSPQGLCTPGTEVTAAQELRIVHNLVTALGDPIGLGAEVGFRTPIISHGVYALAVMSSSTRIAAVDVAARYIALVTTFARLGYELCGAELRLYLDDREIPAELRGFLAERDLGTLLANWTLVAGIPPVLVRGAAARGLLPRLKFFLDPLAVPSIALTDPAAPHLLVFDSAGIEEPMAQANPLAAMLFDEQCQELLHRRGLDSGIAGSIRETLLRRPLGRITQERVAATLNMSLRTMRRRLASEGTTYRQLCVETYGALAEDLLAAGLTVEEVAFRMGYSGAPSFSTAFKQWRGMTPGRFARGASPRAEVLGSVRR